MIEFSSVRAAPSGAASPWITTRGGNEALSRPAHERDAFLREAAGTDPSFFDALRAVTAEAARTDELLQPGGALAPGDRVGAYEVIGILGHGGMGEVYHAQDLQLGRDVALKVPAPAAGRISCRG